MNLLLIDNQSDTFADLETVAVAAGHDVTTISHRDIVHYEASEYDAVVLSGGWWYDDEVELLEQYADEIGLIRACPVPILGICIGMQLMHVAEDQAVPLLDGPQTGSKHILITDIGQKQYGFPAEMEVHKNHTRGIIEVDPDFDVLATSPGHVEMMIHRSKPLLGVQFHPEVGSVDSAAKLLNQLLHCIVPAPSETSSDIAASPKPLIGIPALRLHNLALPYSPYNFGIKHTFIQAIERAGGVPLIIPIYENEAATLQILSMIDGLVLADDNDIEPEHYGEVPRDIRNSDASRDRNELFVLREAEQRGMPVLGVCRGMQLMNVYRGGTLYQDVVTERPDTINHDGYLEVKSTEHLAHELTLEPSSQLARLIGSDMIRSNTHHHQAVRTLGQRLVENAWAPDGVVEGIEDPSQHFFIGVQPHPESLVQRAEPGWSKLFEAHVEASRDYRETVTARTLHV